MSRKNPESGGDQGRCARPRLLSGVFFFFLDEGQNPRLQVDDASVGRLDGSPTRDEGNEHFPMFQGAVASAARDGSGRGRNGTHNPRGR